MTKPHWTQVYMVAGLAVSVGIYATAVGVLIWCLMP